MNQFAAKNLEHGNKLKLLIIQEASGGCGRHVLDLVENLDKSIFEITVLYGASRADQYYLSRLRSLEHDVRFIPSPNLCREINIRCDWSALREIRALIRDFKPDIVHCHSSKAGILGRFAAKQEHVSKIFYTPHAYSFQALEFSSVKKKLFITLERLFSRYASTATFNVSEGERAAALAEHLDVPDKFVVVYNGIPDITFQDSASGRQQFGIPLGAKVIGCAARAVAQKDPMTFMKIVQKVAKDVPEAYGVFIGDGPFLDAMKEYAMQTNITKKMFFLGYRNDSASIINMFDVYLSTALYEGLPYSLIESLRAGVPVVATDVTGNNEIVVNDINGMLFPVQSVSDGASCIEHILNCPPSKDQIRKTFEPFKVKRMVESITEHYLND